MAPKRKCFHPTLLGWYMYTKMPILSTLLEAVTKIPTIPCLHSKMKTRTSFQKTLTSLENVLTTDSSLPQYNHGTISQRYIVMENWMPSFTWTLTPSCMSLNIMDDSKYFTKIIGILVRIGNQYFRLWYNDGGEPFQLIFHVFLSQGVVDKLEVEAWRVNDMLEQQYTCKQMIGYSKKWGQIIINKLKSNIGYQKWYLTSLKYYRIWNNR